MIKIIVLIIFKIKKPIKINGWCDERGIVEKIKETKILNIIFGHHFAYGMNRYYLGGRKHE